MESNTERGLIYSRVEMNFKWRAGWACVGFGDGMRWESVVG